MGGEYKNCFSLGGGAKIFRKPSSALVELFYEKEPDEIPNSGHDHALGCFIIFLFVFTA